MFRSIFLVIYPLVVYYAFLTSVYCTDSFLIERGVLLFSFVPLVYLLRKTTISISIIYFFFKISVCSSILLGFANYINPFYPKMEFDVKMLLMRSAVYIAIYLVALLFSLVLSMVVSKLRNS